MMIHIIVHDDYLDAKIRFAHNICKPSFLRQSTLHVFNNTCLPLFYRLFASLMLHSDTCSLR